MNNRKLIGWVHVFNSKEDLYNFVSYISDLNRRIKLYVQFYAVIFKPVRLKNNKVIDFHKWPLIAVLTESFGEYEVERLVRDGKLDPNASFKLKDIANDELEIYDNSLTARIKNAQYFTFFSELLQFLEKNLKKIN